MQTTPAENALITHLGVYGIWIVKHGKSISRTSDVAIAYGQYLKDRHSVSNLYHAVDQYCKSTNTEEPFQDFDLALNDLASA